MTHGLDHGAGPLRALQPRGAGHQFVCYGDACSGVPGAPHMATTAAVNRVVSRLTPPPELICYPGDAIIGLTVDDAELREQWRFWREEEMGWLQQRRIPLFLTPGNHDVYDAASLAIWQSVWSGLPANGPADQAHLSYSVRYGDLGLVFVNTMDQRRGGEGRANVAWVEQALVDLSDTAYRFVIGHHPVWPVNGFDGVYQRRLDNEDGRALWALLEHHQVSAYLCSHMLAFDVQVHNDILQIMTAGAGTAHRMPPESEYLHCVQLAIDAQGLRYQVLDDQGGQREGLSWPLSLPPTDAWQRFDPVTSRPRLGQAMRDPIAWRLTGVAPVIAGPAQTLLSGWPDGSGLSPLWIGLEGAEQRLVAQLSPQAGRSPHRWLGATLQAGQPFEVTLVLHPGMGPGGILGRDWVSGRWSSWIGASAWGVERLPSLEQWAVGHGQRGPTDRPFCGEQLAVDWCQWSPPDLWD